MQKFPEVPKNTLRIASFDVAKLNFGQWVDEIPVSKLEKLGERYHKLPSRFQRRTRGKMNSNIAKILSDLACAGKRIHLGVYDFRGDKTEKDCKFTHEMRKTLLSHLRSFSDLWKTCEIFVIEQQYFNTFSKGKKKPGANMDTIRVAEAVYIWLLENYPYKEICYQESTLKTQALGAPWGLNDNQRKKWATEQAGEYHKLRGDQDMIDIHDLKARIYRKRLNSEEKIQFFLKDFHSKPREIRNLAERIVRERQKMDDFSDAFIQLLAYLYKTFVARF